MLTRLERFLAKTSVTPSVECILWTGWSHVGRPYFWNGQKYVLAHRWIFQEMSGHAPPVVRHRCDTPMCVNWMACLEPGTQADNVRDMHERGRAVLPPVRAGEAHPNAKLTDGQVEEIRMLYVKGHGSFGARPLGRTYGVSDTQIRNIVGGVQRADSRTKGDR